ncbi:MAG: RNA ligase [Chromatiaceae bacterium]|jgi:putative ATP-dependent DNA ligase|nr:RNA ligase [Chromatiaceae bacterium]
MPIPPDPFPEALERHKARWEAHGDRRYLRLTDDFRGYPKGTLAWRGHLIPGYPRIGRIFRLEQGLAQQFTGPFWMEEKIDGFNVRVFCSDGEMLALSRGGYVCPFATDRVPDFIPPALFEAHPDLVLCAELAGPDNPYTQGGPSFITQDVQLFVFDMMRLGQPGFLPQAERWELCEAFALPTARTFGRFRAADWPAVLGVVEQLDAEGREGAVFKEEAPGGHRTKFVTAWSGVYDIAVRAEDTVELPGDFFTGRILRLALYLDEAGRVPDDRLHRDLGRAFLEGLGRSVALFKHDGHVFHNFRCRFRHRENAIAFMAHLRAILGHTHLAQRRLEEEGGYWVLEFEKEVPKLTGLLHQLFRGASLLD